MESEREVGGMKCSEVLAMLSAYVEGELSLEGVMAVQEHVKHCEACMHFGGRYSKVVNCMRQKLAAAEPLDADIASRLDQCLRNAL